MSKTGEFDLNFPGATIICDTQEKKLAILNYLNGRSPNFDLDLSTDKFQNTLEQVVFNTTYIHEGRHLHDYLTAPLLTTHWLQRIFSLSFSVIAIDSWKHSSKRYKYLPLPFNRWLGLTPEKKSDLLRHKGISENDVPFYNISAFNDVSSDELDKLPLFDKYLIYPALAQIQMDEEKDNFQLDSYNTDYSVRSFMESLAFIIQSTEIVLKYGDEGERFADFIREKSFENFMSLGKKKRNEGKEIGRTDYLGYTNYSSMFTYVYRFCFRTKVNPYHVYPFIAYMLFWGLCGDPTTNTSRALAPRNRLESFFHLDEKGYDMVLCNDETLHVLFNNPLETFNSWDNTVRKAYLSCPINMVIQNEQFFPLSAISGAIDFRKYYTDIVHEGEDLSLQLKSIGYNSVSNYIHGITGAMAYMADMMLKSAPTYLYPEMYVQNLNKFVNVPFRIQFTNGIAISESELTSDSNIIFDNGMIYGNSLNQHSDTNRNCILKCKDYIESKKYIDFYNVLLGTSLIEKPGSLIREMLPGIKPWFINV